MCKLFVWQVFRENRANRGHNIALNLYDNDDDSKLEYQKLSRSTPAFAS